MTILVNIRQLGKKRAAISAVPFVIHDSPASVRELISAIVEASVAAYNERARRGEAGIQPMTQDSMTDMASVGKLAFDVDYNGREADSRKAVANALQCFEDGLYRVFLGDTELTELDAPMTVCENDIFTFIRLTMLTGSLW